MYHLGFKRHETEVQYDTENGMQMITSPQRELNFFNIAYGKHTDLIIIPDMRGVTAAQNRLSCVKGIKICLYIL